MAERNDTDPIEEFIGDVLGDRPGVDRPYDLGDTVTDSDGREWTLVLDHSPCFCGPHVRWAHHEPHPDGGYGGHNMYRDDLPDGVPAYRNPKVSV